MICAFWAINIGLLWLWEKLDLRSKNWLRYLASVAICVLGIIVVVQLLAPHNPRFPPNLQMPGGLPRSLPLPRPPREVFIVRGLLQSQAINIIIMVLLELILLRAKHQLVETENTKLRIANLETRHGQLKQQLHPHFLFNSLSILKSLIKRSPESAENYLEKLSDLLRYSTNNSTQTLVSLSEELDLVTNYLDMQKIRFGDAISFCVNVPEEMKASGFVPAYSIQLLAENAIKHNFLTKDQPLTIKINSDPVENTITIVNNLHLKPAMEDSRGIGLSNLTERYKLLGKEVLIHRTGEGFFVTIKVFKNESSDHRG